MDNSLMHLVYVSCATRDFSDDELRFLLKQSRDKNLRQNVTGMLLYAKDTFFQVLEGNASDVYEIYRATLLSH